MCYQRKGNFRREKTFWKKESYINVFKDLVAHFSWYYGFFWGEILPLFLIKTIKKICFLNFFFFFNFFLKLPLELYATQKSKVKSSFNILILFSKIIFTNQKEWRQNYIKRKNEYAYQKGVHTLYPTIFSFLN